MILKLKRTPGIYLVGFMGSGKSTIGAKLADELGWHFGDLDEDIVRTQKTPISEIFDTHGEAGFREIERVALRQRVRAVQSGRPLVLALGGGTFVDPENNRLLAENGVTVWLDCPFERIRERIGETQTRPLARDPKRFEELFHARRNEYSRCDYRVEVDSDDAALVTAAVLELPLFK
ncbi:MAG TPA: shikimate kinase [Bryobacteraceae bacterium]